MTKLKNNFSSDASPAQLREFRILNLRNPANGSQLAKLTRANCSYQLATVCFICFILRSKQ